MKGGETSLSLAWWEHIRGMYINNAPDGRLRAHTTYVRPVSTNGGPQVLLEGVVHTTYEHEIGLVEHFCCTYLWKNAVFRYFRRGMYIKTGVE